MSKAIRTRDMRHKRPALLSMGWERMRDELYSIAEACETVKWYEDNDEDTLLNALDGDEDELWEFKLAFGDLCADAERLTEALSWSGMDEQTYNDCTVALIGNCYKLVGYDDIEEDYSSLTGFEQRLAYTDAGKRLMRLTKAEMITTIGQCVGILVAFIDLRQQYDYLKATMDVLKDENTALLDVIRQITVAYEAAAADDFYDWYPSTKTLNNLLAQIPDRLWVE